MIKKIKLKNFRKFSDLELDIDKNVVVFYGDNAKGKSSVLESIYVCTNGKSPWASNNDEYVNTEQGGDNPYTRITLVDEDKEYVFYKEGNKRIVKIDGRNTTPKKFFSMNASTIFNPEEIEVLMLSSSKRRGFIDDVISTIDYEYIDTLKLFRKVLRQRNAYLKKLAKRFYDSGVIARNDTQLNFWTKQFVELGNIIQEKRNGIINDIVLDTLCLRYVKSNGDERLDDVIERNKRRDIATGYTNIGPHRDDWDLIDGKDIKRFGSRGEKRLAIGKLLFITQDIVRDSLGYYPILLLDDIASELDKSNTQVIFGRDFICKQQTFITVINCGDLPKDILDEAQLFDLNSFV